MTQSKYYKYITLGLLIMVFCSGPVWAKPFVPPTGKTLLFVGQDRDTIALYVGATGNIPGGTMLYTSVKNLEGLSGPTDYGSGPEDGNALLQSYPNSVVQVGLYLVNDLNRINAGILDGNLRKLAQWIKKADRPVYLRIGYEFDNPDNHYDPQEYVQAFRHVVDFMRKEGVTNAAYVWHSYCSAKAPGRQWMDWYPGDEYVDWFGASMFAVPASLWSAADFVKLAREHHKAFMICESTPWGMYTNRGKIDFLKHVFQFIKDQKVEAFCYIDSNWDVMPMFRNLHVGDSRIEEYPEIEALWLKEINQDRYLSESPDLFQSLGWPL